jgi:hypothetical protein
VARAILAGVMFASVNPTSWPRASATAAFSHPRDRG